MITFTAQGEGSCANRLNPNNEVKGATLTMNGMKIKLAEAQDKNGDPSQNKGRGQSVAAFDPADGFKQLLTRVFDTFGESTEVTRMTDALTKLPDGAVVLMAAQDEITQQLDEDAYAAIEALGSLWIRDIQYRESWAMIGVKGARKGSVPEDHGKVPP